MEHISPITCIGDVTRYEIYTAIALLTIILVSSLIKYSFRDSLPHNKKITTLPPAIVDTTYTKYAIGKRQPDAKAWMEKYGGNLSFGYKRWNQLEPCQ